MQSLARTSGLPRLLRGAGSDTLGGLRPGHDRAMAGAGVSSAGPDRVSSGFSRDAARQNFKSQGSRRSTGWIALAVCAGLVFAALNLPGSLQSDARKFADRIAVAIGFGVDHVAIVGYNRTSIREIAAALDLDTNKSLFGLGASDVRRKLRRLPWVDNVRVVHILPDTVSIEIIERTPFAIWQYRGKRVLVDKSGHRLGPVSQAPGQAFPLVVGKGADVRAGAFLDTLARHPRVTKEIAVAVRVADRRWNLQFHSGTKILLPETGLNTALGTLDALLAGKSLRIADLKLVDLRIPERPTLRLAARAAGALTNLRQTRRTGKPAIRGNAS